MLTQPFREDFCAVMSCFLACVKSAGLKLFQVLNCVDRPSQTGVMINSSHVLHCPHWEALQCIWRSLFRRFLSFFVAGKKNLPRADCYFLTGFYVPCVVVVGFNMSMQYDQMLLYNHMWLCMEKVKYRGENKSSRKQPVIPRTPEG